MSTISRASVESANDGYFERMIKMAEPKKSEEKFYSEDYLSFHDPDAQEAARRAWCDNDYDTLFDIFKRKGKNIDDIMESVIQDCL